MNAGLKATIALAVWLIGSTGASAQTPITYSQDGRAIYTVEMPDFWVARSGGPRTFDDETFGPLEVKRVMALEPETNETAWIGLMSPVGIATLTEARAYISNIGLFIVTEPEVTNSFMTRYGGLPAEVINGVGERNGDQLRFTVVLADLPGDRVAIMVALATATADAGVIEEINAVFRSLRAEG